MNSITISFNQPDVEAPKFNITDRVAIASDCQPEAWATGKVVGLHLEEFKYSPASWAYIVKLDSPLGYTEEYSVNDLVPEAEIPSLQAKWDAEVADWIQEVGCPVCLGKGHQIPHIMMLDGSVTKGDPVPCDLCQGAGRIEVTEIEAYRNHVGI